MEEGVTSRESVPSAIDSLLHPGPTGDFSDQARLYDQIVAPHEDELAISLGRVRNFVDGVMDEACQRVWVENPKTTRRDFENKDSSPLFGYPNGCCLFIVEETLDVLYWILEEEAPYLAEFVEKGGVVAKRWGGYRTVDGREYLQNFIQVGDRIWDVAFEEMETGEKRKVAVSRISEGKYRNFESLGEMIAATEKYYPWTRHFPSPYLLGWVGLFHSNVVFHESTGYLMRGGGNSYFGFDEVVEYLRSSSSRHSASVESRVLSAVEDLLSYRDEELSEIARFVLEEIRFHLVKPMKERGNFDRLVSHAKNFYERQADRIGITREEAFLEFSDIVDRVMGLVSDEHYDRLHAERVAAGLVDGKR